MSKKSWSQVAGKKVLDVITRPDKNLYRPTTVAEIREGYIFKMRVATTPIWASVVSQKPLTATSAATSGLATPTAGTPTGPPMDTSTALAAAATALAGTKNKNSKHYVVVLENRQDYGGEIKVALITSFGDKALSEVDVPAGIPDLATLQHHTLPCSPTTLVHSADRLQIDPPFVPPPIERKRLAKS
ncbi:hypothetical protein HKX48_006761 [Thoreauomyces humboldtii]|nr:hypothetical protein HKX48_006761 [Thoreauomyces humboldtii]